MRSVADDLREELNRKVRELPLAERVAWAFRLGEEDVRLLQAAQEIDRRSALRQIQRQRQAGRQPSKCIEDLLR